MTFTLRRALLGGLAPALATAVFLAPGATAEAQEVSVDVGVDLTSSYIWRGFQFDRKPQIQPWISLTRGGWTVGTWGSYGLNGDYKEQDLWVSYFRELGTGSFSITLFDYYFTEDFGDWSSWGGVKDGEPTGAHTLELIAEYFGPEDLPIRLLVASTVYNDPSSSVYAEVGYDYSALGLDWGATAGALLRDGGYYGLGSSALTNLSLGASRELATLGGRPLAAGALLMHNPKDKDTFFAVTLSF